MCMACEDMEIYYRYLDTVEDRKRILAQPWECEVTLFPRDGDKASVAAPSDAAKSAFVCDEAE